MKVYFELLPGVPYVPLLYPNLGVEQRGNIMFMNNAFAKMHRPFVEVVSEPKDADYILLPHNYPSIRRNHTYIDRMALLAGRYGKKLLVIWHGDRCDHVNIPNAVVLRTSQYGFRKAENEIMMPSYAEDFCGDGGIRPRPHRSGKPVVGFCGWARYKNRKNRVGTLLKNALIDLTLQPEALKKGLTFRMRVLDAFQRSQKVETNFILRSSYSGHSDTIREDPERARKEYVDNLLNSDFALVVKGDGNYSYRFYEALSLGRVPVLLNTDCVLPLRDIVAYEEFVIFVDLAELDRIGDIVADRWEAMTEEEFAFMQRKARAAFETYLSTGSFLRYAVERLL